MVKAVTLNAQELPERLHFLIFFFLPFFSGSGDLSCREMLSLAALVMSCSSSVALHDVTDAVSCVTSRLNHWREEVLVGETSGHV